jgi:toxin YoeB
MLKRLNRLLEDSIRNPTEGIGKPETLRHVLTGCWSRRIDDERQLVCLVDDDDTVVLHTRFHYGK